MIELQDLNNSQKMTSREIAAITGKSSNHVMRDIRNMEKAYTEVFGGESKFGLSEYTTSQNKILKEYSLTKSQALFVVSGYSAIIRAKIQARWEELERQIAVPKPLSRKDLILLALAAEEELEQKTLELKESNAIIEENKPDVTFAKAVKATSNSVLIREFVKGLTGAKIGQNKMFALLREKKYLMKNNEPYQSYIDAGYFEVITRVVGGQETSSVKTTKLLPKGQIYFADKLLNVWFKSEGCCTSNVLKCC